MGLKDLIINFALVGMFTFGVSLAIDNEAPRSIGDDSSITELREDLSNEGFQVYRSNVSNASTAFTDSGTSDADFSQVPIKASTSIWTNFLTTTQLMFSLTISFIVVNIFGGSGSSFILIIGMIGSLVVVVGILYAYKWFRSGDPD